MTEGEAPRRMKLWEDEIGVSLTIVQVSFQEVRGCFHLSFSPLFQVPQGDLFRAPKALLFVSQRGRARAIKLTGLQAYGKGRFMRRLESLVCDLPGTLHSPSLHNPPTVTPYSPSIGHPRDTRPPGYQKHFRLILTAHRLAVRPDCDLLSIRRCWHSESK